MRIRPITPTETHHLRQRVLRPAQALAEMEWPLDHADGSFHLGAEEIRDASGDGLIGIATFLRVPCEQLSGNLQYRLRGMATAPEHQGQGVGTALLRSGVEHLQHLHADLLWCNAREKAVQFYKKDGFTSKGPAFLIEGIGLHHLMFRQL